MTEIILTSSILILLLVILRRALRGRIDPRAQYALWLLVAARLLVPGTLFDAPVSVVGAAEKLQESLLLEEMVTDGLSTDSPAAPLTTEQSDGIPFVTQPSDGPMPAFEPRLPETVQTEKLLDLIWKIGIGITGGAMVLSNLAFYLRLRKSRKLLEPAAAPWAGELPVYEANGLPSPCLFGLFRPAVYLNEAALNAEHPEHILAHEYAHYRHGDHLWSILRSICLIIHWYNPLVWWAAALNRRDCELACDASALRRLGEEERIDYGQTLLGMVSRQTSPASLFRTATTMTAGKRAMTERIALIVKQPRTRKITLALVAALACALAACSFGGTEEKTPRGGPSGLMEFPGLYWNESPEDVMTALGVTEEDFVSVDDTHDDYSNSYMFAIENYPVHGRTAQYVICRFIQYNGTGSGLGLWSVQVSYPDDMEDFSTVLDELRQDYGPETETSDAVSQLTDGMKSMLGDRYNRWEEIMQEPGIKTVSWEAALDEETEALARDLEDNYLSYLERQASWNAYMNPGSAAPAMSTMPPFEQYLEELPGAALTWSRRSVFTPTFNTVLFDGGEYVWMLQILSVNAWARNAGIVVNIVQQGDFPSSWLTYMYRLSWDDIRQAAADQGLGNGEDAALEIMDAISRYAEQNAFQMNETYYACVLTAAEGLDGAPAERYGQLVRQLHDLRPNLFTRTVLELLSEEDRNIILDYYSGSGLSREEVIAQLNEEAAASLTAGPEEIVLTEAGQTGQFLLDEPMGVYTASYTSSNPAVALAMPDGTILALTPGETYVSLAYEGDLGHHDFICHVICDW